MERWERELDRLRSVEAPAAKLSARVDEGPQGDGMPPTPRRGQRIAAGIVAFAVFGGALALAGGALGGDEPTDPLGTAGPEAVLRLAATSGGPDASLTYEGASSAVQVVSYCWMGDGVGMCADTFVEPFASDGFLAVPAGTQLRLETDGNLEDLGMRLIEGQDPLADGRLFTIDEFSAIEPGRYVLETRATWVGQTETITHFVALEITEVSLTPAPDAEESAVVLIQGHDAFLTFGDQRQRGIETDQRPPASADELGETVLSISAFDHPVVVPPGTSIELEGDFEWIVLQPQPPYTNAFANEPGPVVLTVHVGLEHAQFQFEFGVLVEGDEPYQVAVPDLLGLRDQEAFLLLHDLGLDATVWYRDVPSEPKWDVIEMDPPPGTGLPLGGTVSLTIATDVADLPPGATDVLACPAEAFGGPGLRIQPSGVAYVRGNTGGIRDGDELAQATVEGPNGEGLWHIVRDGVVIAVVAYDSLDGVACVGSGIGGV